MKRAKQISKVLIAIIILLLSFQSIQSVYAADEGTVSINNIISAGNSWIETGSDAAAKDDLDTDHFVDLFVGLGQVLVAIGVIVLLIVAVIMAIKWITASPDKKATLKQQLIGLVVAAVVLFGAVGIWNLVKGIMEKTEGELGKSVSVEDSTKKGKEATAPTHGTDSSTVEQDKYEDEEESKVIELETTPYEEEGTDGEKESNSSSSSGSSTEKSDPTEHERDWTTDYDTPTSPEDSITIDYTEEAEPTLDDL